MINYNQLRIFYHVAKNLNYTVSARELFITQPAVTQSMKAFEKVCNLKLLKKTGTKIHLTEEGETLFKYAKNVFEYEKDIEAVIDDMSKMGKGILKIGFPKSFVDSFSTYVTDYFKKNFPDIVVHVEEGSSLSIMHSVVNFEIELGVCAKVGDHPDVLFDQLLREELVCIGSPDHPLAGGGPVLFSDLAKEPILLKEKGSGSQKMLLEIFNKNNLTPNILMETGNSDWIKNVVKKGKGISFLLSEIVAPEIREGRLTRIPIKECELFMDIYLVYLKDHHFSSPAKAFLKLITEVLPGTDILPTIVPSWPEGCQFIHKLK